MLNLKDFWTNEASRGSKHFANELSSVKKKRIKQRFQENLLDIVDLDNVKTAIDWGCGGGLLAKLLPSEINLHLLDISDECMERSEAYIGKKCNYLPISDPQTFKAPEESIDLLWCYAVIHTMPSLDYYRQIVSIWEEIGPKRIAIQTKVNKQDQIAEDYEQDYLNALVLSKNSLLEPFQNYAIEYEKLERIPASWNLTHLILRRKENGADDQSSE
jgi:trans-aconitate methyltransferase